MSLPSALSSTLVQLLTLNMAASDPKKKIISFSIDSILSTSPRKRKHQAPLVCHTNTELTGFPPIPCSATAPIPITPLILPGYPDMRTEDQLSECSDVSDKLTESRESLNSSLLGDSSLLSNDTSLDTDLKSSKRRRSRTAFTSRQIDGLEKRYSEQRYLSVSERSDLAMELELSNQQVKTWFQNRRMKEKRQRRSVRGTSSHQQHPGMLHVPAGGPVGSASGAFVARQMSQTYLTDFVTPRNQMTQSFPYPELYPNPTGYYNLAMTHMRDLY